MGERSGNRRDTYVPPAPENTKPKGSRDNAFELAAGGEAERAALAEQREKMAQPSGEKTDPGRTDNPHGTGVGYAGEGSAAYRNKEADMSTGDQKHAAALRQQIEQQHHQQSSSGQKPGNPASGGGQQSTGGMPPTQGTGSTPQSHTSGADARPHNAQGGGQSTVSAGTPATSQTATERGMVAEQGTIGGAKGQSATDAARDALGSVRDQGAASGTPGGGSHGQSEATHAHPKTDDATSAAQDKAQDIKGQAQAKVGDVKDRAQTAMADAKEHASQSLGGARAQAQDTLESVRANLQTKGDQLKETMTGRTDQLKGTVGEKGDQAKQVANERSTQAGERLADLAGTLRDRTQTMEPESPVASVATRAAGALEQTGSYLQQSTPDDWVGDLKQLISRKPLESVLVAAGLGYMASRAFRK